MPYIYALLLDKRKTRYTTTRRVENEVSSLETRSFFSSPLIGINFFFNGEDLLKFLKRRAYVTTR